ncbi:hypothetical protein Nmel_005699 [Mimus melanotis]
MRFKINPLQGREEETEHPASFSSGNHSRKFGELCCSALRGSGRHGFTVRRSSPHARRKDSSEAGFTGVAGAHLAAVSRGAEGCKAASPAPVLTAAAHSQASLVLPTSSVEDALPPSRLTPPLYRPRSLLLQHRELVEGARGGCLSAVPGQWRRPGHESSWHRRGTVNPSPLSPLLGPLKCPRL